MLAVQWRRVPSGVAGSFVVKVAALLVELALIILLARTLSPSSFGVYLFVIASVTLVSIFAQLGLPFLLVRKLAIYSAARQWGLIAGLIQFSSKTLVRSLVLAVTALVTVFLFLRPAGDEVPPYVVLCAILILLALPTSNVQAATLRGFGWIIAGQAQEFLFRPTLIVALLAIVGSFIRLNASIALLIHTLAAAVTCLVGAHLVKRSIPNEVLESGHQSDPIWLNSMLPLTALVSMQVLNAQLDVVLLGLLRGPLDVGPYKIALQMSVLVAFALAAINAGVAPQIAKLYAQNSIRHLQRLLTVSSRLAAAFALLIALTYVVIGEVLLQRIFGSEFSVAYTSLLILTAGQLINVFFGSVLYILLMTGNELIAAAGVACSAIINVILNILLIPTYGMQGAAIATAITFACWNVILFMYIKKRLAIDSSVFGVYGKLDH